MHRAMVWCGVSDDVVVPANSSSHTRSDAGVDRCHTLEVDNPKTGRLDVLHTRYILCSLQDRWLFRNSSLDLQQDRRFPVVQLHDLVVFYNSCGESLLIVCF